MEQRDIFDAVIIGARVAGATLAALLGDAGHRALLVERAPSPVRRAPRTYSGASGRLEEGEALAGYRMTVSMSRDLRQLPPMGGEPAE